MWRACVPLKERGHYSAGSSEPDEWHGQVDPIVISNILLEGIYAKWLAEGIA